MKYDKIKYYNISHLDICKAFGYKNINSFRNSSSHKRVMNGINILLKTAYEKNNN